jgi:hypothetical protein
MAHEDAFGFLNPDDVVRACHIIPAMRAGHALDVFLELQDNCFVEVYDFTVEMVCFSMFQNM